MLEIASYMKDCNVVELAAKTNIGVNLTEDDQKVVAQFDEWAREIGNTGYDRNHEIAAYLTKTINEAQTEYPSQLIGMVFDEDSIGEFDAVEFEKEPKNTLKAFDAAGGGNVERSFIDMTKVAPTVSNLQVETDISFKDLRRNGWKTVSKLTEFALSALENKLYYNVLNHVDSAITSGDNYIDGTASTTVTQALIDQLSLYLSDWKEGSSAAIIALSKYIQQISKLSGYSSFYSEAMKDELYRNGFLPTYDGHDLFGVGTYRTLGNDGVTKLLPDKRVFGVAGKIGSISQVGEVHTYETEDPNKEQIHLLIKDYKHSISYHSLDKAAKIVLK
jgi:hypothetical protein